MSIPSDPFCIAVDIDSSLTILCTKTAGALRHAASFVEAVELGPADGTPSEFHYNGSAYLVRRALQSPRVGHRASALNRVRVASAVAVACDQRGRADPAMLVTGLNMSSYFSDDGGVSSEVSAYEAMLSTPVGGLRGAIDAAQVRVLPKTVCAFMDWAFDEGGHLAEIEPHVRRVLIVDVGHEAISLAAFDPVSQEVLPGTTTQIKGGWGEAAARLEDHLAEHHCVTAVTHTALLNAVAEGRYVYRGQAWTCHDLLTAFVTPIAAEVSQWVRHAQAALDDGAVRTIVSGLGARAMGDALRNAKVAGLHVPSAPEACNARGMLKFALLAQREGL